MFSDATCVLVYGSCNKSKVIHVLNSADSRGSEKALHFFFSSVSAYVIHHKSLIVHSLALTLRLFSIVLINYRNGNVFNRLSIVKRPKLRKLPHFFPPPNSLRFENFTKTVGVLFMRQIKDNFIAYKKI